MRAVRVAIHCSRMRCRATISCCAAVFTVHRGNVSGAHGVEQRIDIRAISLIATQIALHIADGKQRHPMTVALRHAPQ
jgi:hypothetical protein